MGSWTAMTWNVLFGGEERMDRVLDVVAAASPDVLVLQECLGWESGDRLARVAAALGAPHAVLGHGRPRGSGKRYHVALVSRFAVTSTTTHADPARVGHVILEATVAAPDGEVVVLGTHFDAHGEDERLRDARTLADIAPRDAVLRGRVLVAGDLNALSPGDPYPGDLEDRLRAGGVEKYGFPPRFETMALLEAHGFVDLLPHAAPESRASEAWVTARRDKGGVRIDYRTDYLLASPALAARATEARVIPVNGASDHEAVLARFTA